VPGHPIVIYRPEAVIYSLVPRASRFLVLESLDTFHERQGEQSLLQGDGAFPASWARVLASHTDFHLNGPLQGQFVSGHIYGAQGGADVYARESSSGHQDRFGLFFTYAEEAGDIDGFALGKLNLFSGHLTINDTSLGAYWTHTSPKGWYLDAVYMHSWLIAKPVSTRGIGFRDTGTDDALSLEGGYPIHLSRTWTIEPQAQVIWQTLNYDQAHDLFSAIDYHSGSDWVGRIGFRLQDQTHIGNTPILPYLRFNLWHFFSGTDQTVFNNISIPSTFGSTSAEFGAGLVAKASARLSFWAAGSFTTNIAGPYQQTFKGNLGVRFKW
jgi:outer membrane autotransporter protein